MKRQDLKQFNLPDSPGVYFFKRKNTPPADMRGKNIKTSKKEDLSSEALAKEEVLYIGKATSLKDRVKSYFSKDIFKTRGPLIVDMVTQSNNLDFQKTDSVLEALILEAALIKKHQPIYNTKEKDNKSYNFVVITKDEFPKVYTERGRTLSFDTSSYKYVFGPFPSKQQLEEALKIIRRIFPFLGKKSYSKFYSQIGLEPDTSDKDAKKEYSKTIRNVSLFFQGKKKELIKKLESEMNSYAKKQEFEKASKIRNQIFALNHLRDVSLLKHDLKTGNSKLKTDFRIESYDVAHMSGKNSIGVMTVIEDGEVKKSDYRKFILRDTKRGDDVGGIEEILRRRFKHTEWQLPDLVVIDGGVGQRNRAVKVLKELKLDKTPVVSVVKDDKHKPKNLLGPEKVAVENKRAIILSNSEAHRFAINFFREKARKANFK